MFHTDRSSTAAQHFRLHVKRRYCHNHPCSSHGCHVNVIDGKEAEIANVRLRVLVAVVRVRSRDDVYIYR